MGGERWDVGGGRGGKGGEEVEREVWGGGGGGGNRGEWGRGTWEDGKDKRIGGGELVRGVLDWRLGRGT